VGGQKCRQPRGAEGRKPLEPRWPPEWVSCSGPRPETTSIRHPEAPSLNLCYRSYGTNRPQRESTARPPGRTSLANLHIRTSDYRTWFPTETVFLFRCLLGRRRGRGQGFSSLPPHPPPLGAALCELISALHELISAIIPLQFGFSPARVTSCLSTSHCELQYSRAG